MKKLLSILFVFLSITAFSQVTVRYFNAEWNSANKVSWCHEKKNGLSDCEVKAYDIGKDPKAQNKYKVVVVPTIIIFKDGEEVKRFQADISFSMKAPRKEMQEVIDELLMSDF